MITTVGCQYAKALFDLASQKKMEKPYYEALLIINQVIMQNEDIKKTFNHPVITKDEKKEILENALKQQIDEALLHFLFVLVDNQRLLELDNIVDSYKMYLNDYLQEKNAIIKTKDFLQESDKKHIINNLEKYFNKKINPQFEIDQTIIDGIIIIVDGKVIDGSIANQMMLLKNELKKGW